ncbi:dihydrofolate reductase [Clostridiales bacterium TF09-2AC]|uniref:dihydrofolate reductase n=1 Tax=Enterocloster hominis (ex Hitch et al. 2024) TaxID=1917870 RepID=UPI000E7454E2|nr:dihydrofolate reductase [Lachnoclostridium pacaense]RJW41785.1 dihydrofolate reductase [Clostridiales bacterium TF09-2AC]
MNIIVAADRHWAIGKDGRGLVTIPADQQMLMRETAGKVVVMGRKTLEGMPGGQPLGNRVNVVLSRNEDYKVKGAQVCGSMAKALETLSAYDTDDIYIIGGLSIYEQFLPHADTVHVTRIDYTYDADTFFNNLEKDEAWEMVQESDEQTYFDLCYTFQKFQRKK